MNGSVVSDAGSGVVVVCLVSGVVGALTAAS